MKAKDFLKEIAKAYPDVVAIARDKDGTVYTYYDCSTPFIDNDELVINEWAFKKGFCIIFTLPNIIEWDSENWKENIVTIKDLENEMQGEG